MRDLAAILASGDPHLSDLGAVREQELLFEQLPAEVAAETEMSSP